MIKKVELSKLVQKQLTRLPRHIVEKLTACVEDVELHGLTETRRLPGYHDEPLHGDRQGQRSVRLSKAYRAIYIIRNDDHVECVFIREVSKHAY